jgi:hypothetical protein
MLLFHRKENVVSDLALPVPRRRSSAVAYVNGYSFRYFERTILGPPVADAKSVILLVIFFKTLFTQPCTEILYPSINAMSAELIPGSYMDAFQNVACVVISFRQES